MRWRAARCNGRQRRAERIGRAEQQLAHPLALWHGGPGGIFGIDTQSNNAIGSATVYAADSRGNFTTTYKGSALTSSFLDSGSNGLFFPDSTIPLCFGSRGFYCPASTLSLSAVNTSANGAASGTVNFTVENLLALAGTVRAASVGGSIGRNPHLRFFDWGMPFFFGRTVFVAFDGANTLHGTGPYWAY